MKSQTEQFIEQAELISHAANARGIRVRSSYDGELRFFSMLPAESLRRNEILASVRNYARACSAVTEATVPENSHETREMFAAFLRVSGLHAPSDLVARIEADDCIHGYDLNHELIYASFGFLNLISYSIEEMMCNPWFDLYTSDRELVKSQLKTLALENISGRRREVKDTTYIENHVEYELRSPERRAAAMIPRLNSPLFTADGKVAGYMSAAQFLGVPPVS